jgi:hypothetical protein
MAEIKLTVPDVAIPRIRDAFCAEYNYQETVLNQEGEYVPNPQNKLAFTKQQIIEFVKQTTRNYEANKAAGIARQEAAAKVDEISIS